MKNLIVVLVFLVACNPNNTKPNSPKGETLATAKSKFAENIDALVTSDTMMTLRDTDSIWINHLFSDSEITYADSISHPSGYVHFGQFDVIRSQDVLRHNDYVLILLREQDSDIVRSATLTSIGQPIETILLSKSIGNNECKIQRTGYNESSTYDAKENEFSIVESRSDTEWIDYPTKGKDVVTYEYRYSIKLNQDGRFVLLWQGE